MTNLDDTGQRDDVEPPAGPPSRSRSVTFTAVLAALDAMLGVLANKFFDAIIWAVVVIVVGVVVVALTVVKDRADKGHQFDEARIKRILTSRTFVALAAAAVAIALTLVIAEPFDKDTPAVSAQCDYKAGQPGVVAVRAGSAVPADLSFCPALLNGGEPLTGPFNVAGRFTGAVEKYQDMVVVGRAVQNHCDIYGNRPDPGYYYQSSLQIEPDGRWSFRDGVGYAEAVTLARDYQFIDGPPDALTAIRSDRTRYAEEHNGYDGYTGIRALPSDARIVATFRQPAGKYKGKGPAPCKKK